MMSRPGILNVINNSTAQQIFDYVAAGLWNQNCQAMSIHGRCQYETEHGQHCAAGLLMTEEEISVLKEHDLNDRPFEDILDFLSKSNFVYNQNCELVRKLQLIHDTWSTTATDKSFREHLFDKMTSLAEVFNLNTHIFDRLMKNDIH